MLCINRNILECKFFSASHTINCILVLIETYWNVNISILTPDSTASAVLIETYWNVNVRDVALIDSVGEWY